MNYQSKPIPIPKNTYIHQYQKQKCVMKWRPVGSQDMFQTIERYIPSTSNIVRFLTQQITLDSIVCLERLKVAFHKINLLQKMLEHVLVPITTFKCNKKKVPKIQQAE